MFQLRKQFFFSLLHPLVWQVQVHIVQVMLQDQVLCGKFELRRTQNYDSIAAATGAGKGKDETGEGSPRW